MKRDQPFDELPGKVGMRKSKSKIRKGEPDEIAEKHVAILGGNFANFSCG
jgi:hypothetical protein